MKPKQALSASGLAHKAKGAKSGAHVNYASGPHPAWASHHDTCVVKIVKGNNEDEAEEVDILH